MLTRESAPERQGLSLPKAFHVRYFALIFFLIRRSSMKQSPEVVQRTQPIMMITFMSIGAGSSPACALRLLQTYTTDRNYPMRKRYSKRIIITVTILVSQPGLTGCREMRKLSHRAL